MKAFHEEAGPKLGTQFVDQAPDLIVPGKQRRLGVLELNLGKGLTPKERTSLVRVDEIIYRDGA
jgi:hypothetical protein